MDENQFFELATRMLSGEASPQDKTLFDSFLEKEEYKRLFTWIKEQWDKKETPRADFNYQRGLEKLRDKIKAAEGQEVTTRTIGFSGWRVAASILLVMSIGVYAYFTYAPRPELKQITQSTRRGERRTIQLPDGSRVSLNAESTLQYPAEFDDDKRQISLEGEAFFEVVRNPEAPFSVDSRHITTTVLGTSFNILAYDDADIHVAVNTGKVSVASDSLQIFLSPGEQGTVNQQTGELQKSHIDIQSIIDWKEGVLHFDEVTLQKAITMIERWYNVDITCDNAGLLGRTLRGKYKEEKLETVLDDLQFIIGFKYTRQPDGSIRITE